MTSTELRPGTRLRCSTCGSELIVIKAAGATVPECGGQPMVAGDGAVVPAPHQDGAGAQLGKRYTDTDGSLEVLCTRAGTGALALGGTPLGQKAAKPLPASD